MIDFQSPVKAISLLRRWQIMPFSSDGKTILVNRKSSFVNPSGLSVPLVLSRLMPLPPGITTFLNILGSKLMLVKASNCGLLQGIFGENFSFHFLMAFTSWRKNGFCKTNPIYQIRNLLFINKKW
jgi:hypothetical protein